MSRIYFLRGFNNYYNRKIKKFSTINDYLEDVGGQAETDYIIRGTSALTCGNYGPVNFNINDGVMASMTYNYKIEFNQDWEPDYVLVCDDNANPELDKPKYCFFVMECKRNCKGQNTLTLKRDVVADCFDEILNSPVFLDKGPLKLTDAPFVYNSEDISFNQIKQEEVLLKDRTKCPWIVGFIASNQPETTETTLKGEYRGINSTTADFKYNKMSSAPFWGYISDPAIGPNTYKKIDTSSSSLFIFTLKFEISGRNQNCYFTYMYNKTSGIMPYECYIEALKSHSPFDLRTDFIGQNYANDTIVNSGPLYDLMVNIGNKINETILDELISFSIVAGSMKTEEQFNNDLKRYDGKTIYVSEASEEHPLAIETFPQGYYKVEVPNPITGTGYGGWNPGVDYTTGSVNRNSDPDISIRKMLNIHFSSYMIGNGQGYDLVYVACPAQFTTIYPRDIYTSNTQISLSGEEPALKDAPYRMFCMPYNENNVQWTNVNGATIKSDKNINMSIAQAIASKLSGNWLYDLQLVPYCPFANSASIISETGGVVSIDCSQFENKQLVVANGSVAVMIFCYQSQLKNLQIPYNIPKAINVIDLKLNVQCKSYRLSSPSYNSIFEFNAERNGGVDYFDVDFVYKPFDSYVHVNPNFGLLYGSDFNDARGLIFTGPFSLPQTTSAWHQYKMNNMNYQDSFDRQIQNMETMHGFDMTERYVKAVTGTIQGALTGAAAGSIGGKGTAIAGAVVGATASAIGGAVDLDLAKKRFAESKDFATDNFNYSLQNIKAMPQTIGKVSAFTPNNKVFPVLEIYDCTLEEKNSFKDKLKYNGMTIGKIGTIAQFIQNDFQFFKVRLIRCESMDSDFHMLSDLAEELDKGVFIKL